MPQKNQHFYIDYCPYNQAICTLQAMNSDIYLSSDELAEIIGEDYRTEVRRRLLILNIAQEKENGRSVSYALTRLGNKLKEISYFDPELLPDLFHYLHLLYGPADDNSPKMLWSYASCCKILWDYGELLGYKEIASIVQNKMKTEFPDLDFTASKGARFDHYAVSRWASYVKNLNPSPFDENNKLQKRSVSRYELILLSLSHLYFSRNYRFGDPVVVSRDVLDELSSIFFLDQDCSKQLINLAVKLSPLLTKRDTYGGMAITLKEPYSIERL